jgi:hypothetical protein
MAGPPLVSHRSSARSIRARQAIGIARDRPEEIEARVSAEIEAAAEEALKSRDGGCRSRRMRSWGVGVRPGDDSFRPVYPARTSEVISLPSLRQRRCRPSGGITFLFAHLNRPPRTSTY